MRSFAETRAVAELARLHLTDRELDDLGDDLGKILEYVGQLQAVDTANVQPLAHPLPLQNVFRDDEPAESLPVDDALQNAPDRHGAFFAVPAVLN